MATRKDLENHTNLFVDPSFEFFVVVETRVFTEVGSDWPRGLRPLPESSEPRATRCKRLGPRLRFCSGPSVVRLYRGNIE